MGAAADLHHLSRTSLLFSRILAPLFQVPFISFLSSQLLSTRVGSLHCNCTSPVFVSAQSDDSVANFFDDSIELPFHWIMAIIFVLSSLCHVQSLSLLHPKACTKYFPVLLRTTKLATSTSQYYFVLQSLHKVLPSTISYYKACTKYFPVRLRTTKLAQSTSHYYFVLQSLHKVLPSTPSYYKLAQSTSQ